MARAILVALITTICASASSGLQAHETVGTQTEILSTQQLVKSLGVMSKGITGELNALNDDRHTAIKLLIGELHPVKSRTYYPSSTPEEVRHVIACLRALHYLTGLTFSAETRSRLNDDQRQFVDFKNQMHDDNPTHELHFFGVWMSRDADIVAPIDTQRKIINRWREWQKKNSESFDYAPPAKAEKCMDSWYWFG